MFIEQIWAFDISHSLLKHHFSFDFSQDSFDVTQYVTIFDQIKCIERILVVFSKKIAKHMVNIG